MSSKVISSPTLAPSVRDRDSERVRLVSSVFVTDWVFDSLECWAVNHVLVFTTSMVGFSALAPDELPPPLSQPPPDLPWLSSRLPPLPQPADLAWSSGRRPPAPRSALSLTPRSCPLAPPRPADRPPRPDSASASAARSRAARTRASSARERPAPDPPLPAPLSPAWMWTWLSCRGTSASEYDWPLVAPVVCVTASPSARPLVCVVDSVEVL